MTEEMSQSIEVHPQTFGHRLKTAREDLRLEVTDVASQLRLRPTVIEMLEKEMYSDDMPITFLRGYLRSYAKFLEIPEKELNSALSVAPFLPPIPTPAPEETNNVDKSTLNKVLQYADKSLNKTAKQSLLSRFCKKYFMKIVTFTIIFTMGYLVVTWWNNHKAQVNFLPMTTQQAAVEPTVPTMTSATDQDLEAANDDQALVFEQDGSTTTASTSTALSDQTELALNENKNIIDIYNE